MDSAQVFAVLTAIIFMGSSLGFMALAEYRAQLRQKEEQHREMLLALFRISKEQTRHVDALGVVLLRALRREDVSSLLLAEVKREVENVRALNQGEVPPPSRPPTSTGEPEK